MSDAWVVVGLINEAVQRFQRASDEDEFWRLVCDNWRWVVPSRRLAILVEAADGLRAIQRVEGGALGGPWSAPVVLGRKLRRGLAARLPSWLGAGDAPADGFEGWLLQDGPEDVLVCPLRSGAQTVGGIVAVTESPSPKTRATAMAAAGTYASHVAATWTLLRLAEERAWSRKLESLNQQLAEARDRALAASRAKSTFLANMSHELRTPLNAVIGYSELLLEDEAIKRLDSAVTDLRRVLGAAHHLLDLISDVLDLAKIEAGKLELEPVEVDLADILVQVVDTATPLAKRNGNRIVLDADPALGLLRLDPLRVRQLLLNLVGNACKFTVQGEIYLSAQRRGPEVWFVVRDTGIGMTRAQVERAFEAFEQVHQAPGAGGTGLGLPITRRLATLMGGDLRIVSQQSVGTTVTVRLPVCTAPPVAVS